VQGNQCKTQWNHDGIYQSKSLDDRRVLGVMPTQSLKGTVKSVLQVKKQGYLTDHIKQYDPPDTKCGIDPGVKIGYGMTVPCVFDHIQLPQFHFQPKVSEVHKQEGQNQESEKCHIGRSETRIAIFKIFVSF